MAVVSERQQLPFPERRVRILLLGISCAILLPFSCLSALHRLHEVRLGGYTVSGYFEPHAMADGARWQTGVVRWNEHAQGGVMVQIGHWNYMLSYHRLRQWQAAPPK